MVHLKNSTDNFTKIPKSFAIDITPARIFGKRDAAEYRAGKSKWKDLVLSIAYRDSSDVNLIKNLPRNPQIGLGFNIPLTKRKINKFSTEKVNTIISINNTYDRMMNVLNKANLDDEESLRNSKNKDESLSNAVLIRSNFLQNSLLLSQKKALLREQNYTVIRTDFSLNFSGGFVRDYGNRTITSKSGLWLTGGYDFTGEKSKNKVINNPNNNVFSILALLRWLNNLEPEYTTDAEKIYSNFYDFGLKMNFTNNTIHHFNFAVEGIYRKVSNPKTITDKKPSAFKDGAYRFALNTEYQLSKNMLLTLALGRDFEGNYTKNGNVFALLNFVGAIGSKRSE